MSIPSICNYAGLPNGMMKDDGSIIINKSLSSSRRLMIAHRVFKHLRFLAMAAELL
jgi:hypothetical protein